MITSENSNEILSAFYGASLELENPTATMYNPHYKSKYTPLDELIVHIKQVIHKYKLFIVQEATVDNQFTAVITRVVHTSGQWLETTCHVPKGADAQKQGASITYARRYALCSLFNISSEVDDDGNSLVPPKVGNQVPARQLMPDNGIRLDLPEDVRQLFLEKHFKTKEAVDDFCKIYKYDWQKIKEALHQG